jgi:hypothetical protein
LVGLFYVLFLVKMKMKMKSINLNVLYIYTTKGCHLCEQAELLLHQASPYVAAVVEVELIDIAEEDNSDELIEVYGERIPVFEYKGLQLNYPFTMEAVIELLNS